MPELTGLRTDDVDLATGVVLVVGRAAPEGLLVRSPKTARRSTAIYARCVTSVGDGSEARTALTMDVWSCAAYRRGANGVQPCGINGMPCRRGDERSGMAKEKKALAALAAAEKATRAPKAPKGAKAAKTAKAPKGAKAVKTAKALKAAKPTKGVKAPKAVKAPKGVKAPKAVKAPKGVKAPKAVKTPKAVKGAPRTRS